MDFFASFLEASLLGAKISEGHFCVSGSSIGLIGVVGVSNTNGLWECALKPVGSFWGFGVDGGDTGTGDVLPPRTANLANLRFRILKERNHSHEVAK